MVKKNNAVRGKIIQGLDLTYRKLMKTKKDQNLDFVVSDKKGEIIHLKAKSLNLKNLLSDEK